MRQQRTYLKVFTHVEPALIYETISFQLGLLAETI